MVDDLLSFLLCKCSILKISVNIDIKECRDTSYGHSCTILCLDCCKVSEVQPLSCFVSILSRLRNIESVCCSHLFHLFQSFDLICKLFTKTEILTLHAVSCVTLEVILFSLDQEIDTVQCNTTVVTYDTSTSVCIRKSCDDLVMTSFFHLWCINIKYTLVMCFMIFCEDLMQFLAWLVSVCCTSLLCHLDSTVRHECSLQRFVCLQTNNLLKVFHALIDISWAVCCQTGNNFCLHVENSALSSFFFLKFLQSSP